MVDLHMQLFRGNFGVVSFNLGDTYWLTVNDGQPVQVQVVAKDGLVDNGDGTVNVSSDGGQTVEPMRKDYIQAMVDETNRRRALGALQEEETPEEEETAVPDATATPEQPVGGYRLNDELELRDDAGNAVHGNIVSERNDDGLYEVETEEPLNGRRVNMFTAEELDALRYDAGVAPEGTATAPEETAAAPGTSALSRVPRDERGEPVYEQADVDTAWDAIVEQAEGNEAIAQSVADSMVADKEAELKRIEKMKPKGGTTVAEKIAAERERNNAVEQAKANLAIWQNIAGTANRRKMDADAERRRLAEEQAVLRKAEEEQQRVEREEAERIERETLNRVPDMSEDTPQAARDDVSVEPQSDGVEVDVEPQPVGRGVFGNIYDQFRGKAQAAIDFLRRLKSGEAVGALHHKDVGDISLVWGDKSHGLAHILDKHPEIAENLQGVLDGMGITQSSENRIVLESDTHKAVVSKMLGNEKTPQWLLTAYEKKSATGGSSDIVPEPQGGKQNGTAPLQDTSSAGKGTEPAPAAQTEREKSSENHVLSESEYVDREYEKAAEAAFANSGMTDREEWGYTDEATDLYNSIIDGYRDYIQGLKSSGRLQEIYDRSGLGERIKIRQNIEAAGFEVGDMIDLTKEKEERKRKREEKKRKHAEEVMAAIGINAGNEQKETSETHPASQEKEVNLLDPRTMPEEEKVRRGEMLRTAPAVEVERGTITSSSGLSARKSAEKWWDDNVGGAALYDTEIGKVEINRNSVESSLAHRYGQKKLDAITSLPEGFGNAVYLGTMPDSRERGVVDHYFAYPIMYEGKLNYVFCRAMQDANKNRLYVHEVFVADNVKKGDTLQTAASKPHGGISLYRDILANVLIKDVPNAKVQEANQQDSDVSVDKVSEKSPISVGNVGKNSVVGSFVAPARKEGESLMDYAERVDEAKKRSDEEQKVKKNPTEGQGRQNDPRSPGALVKAYESGDEASIAATQGAVRDFIEGQEDYKAMAVTYFQFKERMRGERDKGSAYYRTYDFIQQSCRAALKKAGFPSAMLMGVKKRSELAASTQDARVLDVMSVDPSLDVRSAVVHNPNMPTSALEHLREVEPYDTLKREIDEVLRSRGQDESGAKPGDDVLFREGEDAYTEEEQGIIDRSKAEGTYMKAPNGKKTNLTAKQWVLVRTKAFKNWFGDWEKAARIAKLRRSKPVEITGEEIAPSEDLKQYKKNALEYGKRLQGSYVNKDTGHEIQLQRGRKNGGINEVLQHNYKDVEHLQSVAAIPQLIENGIYITSRENEDIAKNPNVKEYQYYVCGLKINGTDYTVRFTVAEDKNGNRYYDHKLTRIEKGKLLDLLKSQAVKDVGFGTTPGTKPTTDISIGKDKVLLSILQANSSKVLDKNGEPQVVYHGTLAKGLFRFDKEKIGSRYSYDEKGFFFTSNQKVAKDYSLSDFDSDRKGVVVDAFVSLRNPLVVDSKWCRANGLGSNVFDNNDTIEFWDNYQSLLLEESENNDGVMITDGKDTMVVAFEPNLVKSATENVGSFSRDTDDIRYRYTERNGISMSERASAALDEGKTDVGLDSGLAWFIGDSGMGRFDGEWHHVGKTFKRHYFVRLNEGVTLSAAREAYKASRKEKSAGEIARIMEQYPEAKSREQVLEEGGRVFPDENPTHENIGYTPGTGQYWYVPVRDAAGVERGGEGRVSDAALSLEHDPVSKMLGRSRWSASRQRAFAARERVRMETRARELAEKLNLDNVEIVTDVSELEGRQRRAKGFYSRRSGRITIVIPNHRSIQDVEQTLLHEAVAHYGLRQLFGERFDRFLDQVFEHADEDVRRRIVELSRRQGWDMRVATEEYLASLAENTDFERASGSGWFHKIKELFLKMLRSIGLDGFMGVTLTDNELRYILWRSYENLREPGRYRGMLDEAADVAKQYELKVGEYSGSAPATEAQVAESGELHDVNERFNEALSGLTEENADGTVLSLGRPSGLLRAAGVEDRPMKLYGAKILKKVRKHGFSIVELENLPKAVADPIAVFNNYKKEGNRAILTDLKTEKGHFLVTVNVGKGEDLDFNIVSSVFGKGQDNIVDWIERGLATYINKEKALDYLHHSALRAEALSSPRLSSAAKIVENFENPVVSGAENSVSEEDSLYREGDMPEYEQALARENYERRLSKGMYQAREALQDSMLSLKVGMEEIYKAEGGKKFRIEEVPGFENAYLGENRLSSQNQAEAGEFDRLLFKPLLKEVAKLSRTNADRAMLMDYMMAKHGLERQAVMSERAVEEFIRKSDLGMERPEKPSADAKDYAAALSDYEDALSSWERRVEEELGGEIAELRGRDYAGLTALTDQPGLADATDEARRMVEAYESAHDTTKLWKRVNAVTGATLRKLYEGGLMSKETYEQVGGMYRYYIPLRGFDEKTGEEVYAYVDGGRSSFTAPLKRAKGRSSKADDPLAYMASMAESAIMQANRNVLVKQKFLNFVQNHPSDLVSVGDLWLEHDEVRDEWHPVFADDIEADDSADEVSRKLEAFEAKMEALKSAHPERYRHGKETTGIPYRVVNSLDAHQHQVIVKRGGRDVVLTVNGNPRLAQALNGLTNPDQDVKGYFGSIMEWAANVNRHLSAFYTTRNPDFVVSNFVRDMLYTNTMVWVKEPPKYAVRFHENVARFNPFVMGYLYSRMRGGKLDMDNETERLFHQFIMNGGETGYTQLRDIEKHKTDIRRELKKSNGRIPVRKAWDGLGLCFDEVNRSVENCARFAAFVTSRGMGRSLERSIYDAKEVSVNFNKKGSGSKFLRTTGQTRLGNAAAFVSGAGRGWFVFWNAALDNSTLLKK